MLGDSSSTVLPTQTTTTTTTTEPPPPPPQVTIVAHKGGEGASEGDGSREDEDSRGRDIMEGGGERSFALGGNRWPKQETLALLKIRSDMDVAFKEASVKGPLWEEISRKLAELGYNRSAKKCREKFENVFKYHKRTKEGRTGKSEGKTYRFFDQLEAFESQPALSSPPPLPQPQPAPPRGQTPAVTAAAMPVVNNPPNVTVPSTTLTPPTINYSIPSYPHGNNPTLLAPPPSQPQPQPQPTNVSDPPHQTSIPSSNFPAFSPDFMSDSSSSSTSSDVEIQGRHRRKRKWKDFFERLMREVIEKQEDMQRRFLEAIEKREHERMVREESWRMQETARINREREILAQERSMTAAKDAAVMAFLHKLSDQQNPGQVQLLTPPPSQPPPVPPHPQPSPLPTPTPAPQPLPQQHPVPAAAAAPSTTIAPMQQQVAKTDNGDQNFMPPSSSRWPKVEVEALIGLRTSLESKYQESGPKGPLWEEISSEMRKLGYNRSSKRCKEKWENINKYFKKVKESNKKRPEDSKTCPYFHQLDAIYKEKNKMFDGSSSATNLQFRPENSVPLMVQPEQQWPPPPPGQHEHNRGDDLVMEDLESDQDQQDEDDKD